MILRSASRTADVDANAAKTSEARAIALDQLAEANEESAKLRELNDRFVRELRDSRKATKVLSAQIAAANAKATDIANQMDAANDQNAKLRELNSRFIKELREARNATDDAVAAAEKHRDAANETVRGAIGKHAAQGASRSAHRRAQRGEEGGVRGGGGRGEARDGGRGGCDARGGG